MNDRERTEDERLHEIRQRARELRERSHQEDAPRREPRGPSISAWRPISDRRSRYPYEYGIPVPPGLPAGGPVMPGYSGPYPPTLGGYPGFAGGPMPIGMPFDRGRPGGRSWIGGEDAWSGARRREQEARGGREPAGTRETWTPRARVLERDGAFVVRVELPGLERKDVNVRVEEDRLVIEGERTDDRPAERGPYARSDWGYGPFRRDIDLPHPVDASDIHARFQNGVLEVVVPQPSREERRRRIKVET